MSGESSSARGPVYDSAGRLVRASSEPAAAGLAAPASDMRLDPTEARNNPKKAQGQLIERQREDFNARYRPMEEATIAEYMRSPEEAAQRAGAIAGQSFEGAPGMTARALGRLGGSMTPDQLRAAGDASGLAKARAIGTAENTMRRAVRDRNTDGLGTMVGIGRGIQGGVNRDMGSAAGMQVQREQAHSAAKTQHTQALIGTAAGLAGAFF